MRGLKGSELLHLVDGMRLNFGFLRNAPNQYLALVDPSALAAVEVVRGAASSLYGADAMGGVVNLRSVEPTLAATTTHRLDFAASGATADDARAAQLRLSREGPRWAASLGAAARAYGERRAGGGQELPATAYTAQAADAALRFAPAAGGDWQLRWQHARQPDTPRHDQLVAGFGESAPRRSEFAFAPSQRDFAHLRAHYDSPFVAADSLELNLAWQRIVDATRRRSLGSDTRQLEDNRSQLWGFAAHARSALGAGHTLRYGAEYYRDRIASHAQSQSLEDGSSERRESRFPDGSTMQQAAAYAQHRVEAGPQRLELGLRATQVEVDLAADGSRPASRLRQQDLSGDLGLRRQLGPRLSLHAHLGRGFRAPNVFDLGAIGPRPGGRFNAPNPDLAPEVVYTADLGLKLAGPRLHAEGYVWWSEYRDKIESVFTGAQTDAGEDIVRSENIGRVQLRGAEALLDWHLAPRWSLRMAGEWTWGATAAGAPADRVPPPGLNAALQYRLPEGPRLRLGMDAAAGQSRLSPRDREDSRIAPGGTPGYSDWSLAADFALPRGVDLTLGIENLFDRRYRRHASGVDAAGRGLYLQLRASL